MTDKVANPVTAGPTRAGLVAIIVGIQAIAAIFFIADAIGDLAAGEMDFHILVEALIAFALLAGVGIGAWMARRR
jgi:predicted phage tail protein